MKREACRTRYAEAVGDGWNMVSQCRSFPRYSAIFITPDDRLGGNDRSEPIKALSASFTQTPRLGKNEMM